MIPHRGVKSTDRGTLGFIGVHRRSSAARYAFPPVHRQKPNRYWPQMNADETNESGSWD
jgi:hypothetical protein